MPGLLLDEQRVVAILDQVGDERYLYLISRIPYGVRDSGCKAREAREARRCAASRVRLSVMMVTGSGL
jgi:hypothetical protein